MDHTVRAYLERQSTEALERFLQECLSGDDWEKYAYAIPIIIEIFEERDKQECSPVPEHLLQEWKERVLKRIKGQAE